MRNPDGTLNGDLNDGLPALTSGSIGFYPLSDTNENQTVYDLLPVFVNKPPIITSPISEASNPPIKPYAAADATGDFLYLFPDGAVKVSLGATFTFRLEAQQPSILNVENGVPTMLPPNQGLTYVWRKDGNIVTSYEVESLQTKLVVSGSNLTITNVQPEHAGTYVCEVQNDIGTTSSETVNLEVLNLDFDELFYKNLVKNPYGKQGTDEWESNNDDFTTKQFSEVSSEEFKRPYKVDIFGYTPDMMHPRPYQIDNGVLRGFNMTDDLVLNRGSYFTRARFKYLKRGGTTLVRAYQDIDLLDIQSLIKGGIFGVEGVRAIFSCYIGNGINYYQPVSELLPITRRTDPKYYVGASPRLSIENTLNAGAPLFPQEDIYVSIEEYDNDIRLSSRYYDQNGTVRVATDRLVVRDPWFRKWNWYSKVFHQDPTQRVKVYPTDFLGYGSGPSNGDFLDVTLLTAQELYPVPQDRYTYGQYVEFNKLVLERLNPKTTKIRIVLNFVCNDLRIFDTDKYLYENSDEIFEVVSWEYPWRKNRWTPITPLSTNPNTITILKSQDARYGGTDPTTCVPLANDPRGMITALNLSLLPILKQNPQLTQAQTNNSLTLNTALPSIVPNVLNGRPYDPYSVNTNKWRLNFGLNDSGIMIKNDGTVVDGDELELFVEDILPQQNPRRVPIDTEGLFPFTNNSIVFVEGIGRWYEEDPARYGNDRAAFKSFAKYRYIPRYNNNRNVNDILPTRADDYNNAAQLMYNYFYVTDKMVGDRIPDPILDQTTFWNNKVRYYFSVALSGSLATNTTIQNNTSYYTQLLNLDNPDGVEFTDVSDVTTQDVYDHRYPIIGYYLDIDFSNPNNKRVTVSRPHQLFPPEDGGLYGSLSATQLSGSYALEHTVDDNNVLKVNLSGILTAPISAGGFSYKSIKDTLPDSGPYDQFRDGSWGIAIIPYNERSPESIITITNHPIQCIRVLRTNIGSYSYVPVTNNYFYNKRVLDIFEPINSDILALEADPNYAIPFTLNQLKTFSASLNDYAYNNVPYYQQLTTSNPVVLNEPNIYQDINLYYNVTLNLDMADTTFANLYTLGLENQNQAANQFSRQTLRSPDLLNLRVRSNSIMGPSLVCIKPVDIGEPGSGIGSPSYGQNSAGSNYNVVYAPLRDKVAGTYL